MVRKGVSVLMAVYYEDNAVYFNEAIASITVNQIERPSQVVLVCDGPLRKELDSVIQRWEEDLDILCVIRLEENVGLASALNAGLDICEYELVARMDADDIADPHRLMIQKAYMNENSNIHVSSCWVREVEPDDTSIILSIRELPLSHDEIVKFAKRRNPISHPASIYRRDAVLSVGGYPDFRRLQDFALWSLMISKGKIFANLETILVEMRTGDGLMARRGRRYLAYELKLFGFQRRLGILNCYEYYLNCLFRMVLRLSPSVVRSFLYKKMR